MEHGVPPSSAVHGKWRFLTIVCENKEMQVSRHARERERKRDEERERGETRTVKIPNQRLEIVKRDAYALEVVQWHR